MSSHKEIIFLLWSMLNMLGAVLKKDNFSCERGEKGRLEGISREELCDNITLCTAGEDEGNGLHCNSSTPFFSCKEGTGATVPLTALCDGVDDCGQVGGPSGQDEIANICDNKCLLPYYGGCALTRMCNSMHSGVTCGECLSGFVSNGNDCIAIKDRLSPVLRQVSVVEFKFSSFGYQVSEGNSSIEVCVVLSSGVLPEGMSITLLTSDRSARHSEDFGIFRGSVFFTPTTTTRCIPIGIIDDLSVEGNETFVVIAEENEFFINSQVTITIQDDDVAQIQLVSSAIFISESQSPATVALQIVVGEFTSIPISVKIFTTTVGNASADVDFKTRNDVGVFSEGTGPGEQINFNVTINDDDLHEETEEIVVTIMLISPQPAMAMFVGGGLSRNASVFILDDDEIPTSENSSSNAQTTIIASVLTASGTMLVVLLLLVLLLCKCYFRFKRKSVYEDANFDDQGSGSRSNQHVARQDVLPGCGNHPEERQDAARMELMERLEIRSYVEYENVDHELTNIPTEQNYSYAR